MSLWVQKFIKKVVYSKDEITISIYYRENFGEEAAKNDASGWVAREDSNHQIEP
jgi:hypothetical protein